MKQNIVLDFSLIDVIGVKQFYVLYRKVTVRECKTAGLTQSQTLNKLNSELVNLGQKPVTLSLIKYLW